MVRIASMLYSFTNHFNSSLETANAFVVAPLAHQDTMFGRAERYRGRGKGSSPHWRQSRCGCRRRVDGLQN